MNKPMTPPVADDTIGPLDEHGQQIWSAAEDAAIARMHADPDFWPSIERSRAALTRGNYYTTDQMLAELERRRGARRAQA